MAPRVTRAAAISAIDRWGACLVYPIENRAEPPSLWTHFHPRTPMRWEWDAGGDDRVPELWHLREELSRSGRVVYAKWFRGRATFFSLPLFSALTRLLADEDDLRLTPEARALYQAFEERSPLSTREAKESAGLKGREHGAAFERAMKQLWSRLLVVGFGERDDGAFPSLLVGASKWLQGEAWRTGRTMTAQEALTTVSRVFPSPSPFRRELDRLLRPPRPLERRGSAQGPRRL